MFCVVIIIHVFSSISARRKSNCVKAVESIQKKRDERRAQHEELKRKNERDYDISDPNWEFMAMIKLVVDSVDVLVIYSLI